MQSTYDPLDDVPIQFRRSPAPSHYSLVPTTPSTNPQAHNLQEVMSPSAPSTTPHQQAAAAALASAELQQSPVVTFRQMTQIQMPADALRSFATSISDDISFAADIQAAMIELSSRVQYRTEVLATALENVGQTVNGVQEGYGNMVRGMEKLHADLQRQQEVIQGLVDAKARGDMEVRATMEQMRNKLKQSLEMQVQDHASHQRELNGFLQREAAMSAKMEMLEAQVAKLRDLMKAQDIRLNCQAEALQQTVAGQTGASRSATGDMLVEELRARVDSLSNQTSHVAEAAETLLARVAMIEEDSWKEAVQEELGQLRQDMEVLVEGANDRATHFPLTPDAYCQDASGQPQFDADEAENEWWGWQGNNREKMDNHYAWREDPGCQNPWGLTPPPGLVCEEVGHPGRQTPTFPGLVRGEDGQYGQNAPTDSGMVRGEDGQHGHSAPAGAGLVRGEDGQHGQSALSGSGLVRGEEGHVGPPAPTSPGLVRGGRETSEKSRQDDRMETDKEQWKVLTDIPNFDFSGKTPWELGMSYTTWKRQLCTVAGTASGKFQSFVEACVAEAEMRYQCKAQDREMPALGSYSRYPSGYAGRLVVQLLRVLPERITAPAMEMTSSANEIHPVQILEELSGQVQPGGCSEQTSLTKFIRSLEPAGSATEAVQVLRRWKLARSRIQSLGLPEAAPFELLKGLQTLIARLEKKHDSLRTRMSLCRLDTSIQLGKAQGVELMLENIEKELRLLSADEYSKSNTSGEHEISLANKGKGKGFKGKGKDGTKGVKGQEDKKKIPCPFLQKGSCSFGDRCYYKHPDASHQPPPTNPKTDAQRKKIPCRNHKKGTCKFGDKCRYLHEDAATAKAAAKASGTLMGVEKGAAAKAKASAAVPKASSVVLASVCKMARSDLLEDENSPSSSDSEMTHISEAASDESTASYARQSQDEFSEEEFLDTGPQRNPLWRLHMRPDEFLEWQRGHIMSAPRDFQMVTDGLDVAVGVMVNVAHLDQGLPAYNIPIDEEQEIVSVHDVLIMCEDNVARPGVIAWLLDLGPSRNELFLAAIESPRPPKVRQSRATRSQDPLPAEHMRPQSGDPYSEDLLRMSIVDILEQVDFKEGAAYFDSLGVEIVHDLVYLEVEHFHGIPELARIRLLELRGALMGSGSSQGSQARKAQAMTGDGDVGVLLDSGANEIVRTAPDPKPHRSRPSPLQLADGQSVQAWRTREGEIYIQTESGRSTLCGLCKLVDIGATFTWSPKGAALKLPPEVGDHWVSLGVRNGLPYLPWEHYRILRPMLTRQWKSRCSQATVQVNSDSEPVIATQEESQIIEWDEMGRAAMAQEEAVAHRAVDAKDGEEFAKALMGKENLTYVDIADVVARARLPCARTNRMNKIQNAGKQVNLWVFGAWSVGGLRGVTSITKERPWLTKILTKFISSQTSVPFLSFVVSQDVVFKPHQDPNDAAFDNVVIGFSEHKGGEVWIEADDESKLKPEEIAWRMVKAGGEPLAGTLQPTSGGKVVIFNGRKYHGTEPYEGSRKVLVAYVPRGWKNLDEKDQAALEDLGFKAPADNATPADHMPQAAASHTMSNATPPNNDPNEPLVHPISTTSGEVQGSVQASEQESLCLDGGGQDYDMGIEVEFGEEESLCHAAPAAPEGRLASEAFDEAPDLELPDSSFVTLERETEDDEAARRKTFQELAAQGLRHPHRRVKPADIALGSLAIDIAGPYKESFGGYKYFVVGIFTFQVEGMGLAFAVPATNRKVETILGATEIILAQLSAITGTKDSVVRLHSDNGLELVTSRFNEAINKKGIFRTTTVPYNPSSNGRAERQVQALKRGALQFLIEGGLERRFWPFCVMEAAACQRDIALGMRVPKLVPGDTVAIKLDHVEAFEPRAERAVFLSRNASMSKGAFVLVTRNGSHRLMRVRAPVKLEADDEKWRVASLDGKKFWVSSKGSVKEMDSETIDELPTLEERAHGPVDGDLVLGARLGEGAVVAKVAQSNEPKSCDKYHVETFEEEADAEEQERILNVLAKQKAGAETVSAKVFTTGTEEAQHRWFLAAQKEVASMEEMEVWDELPENPLELREHLGLKQTDEIPAILPMSLVCTEKPVLMQQDKHVLQQGAAIAAEQASAAILERVRLVVCGNYEDTSGIDTSAYASSNVDVNCLRVMYSELANHQEWEGMGFDVSHAFLYSDLKSKNTILMRPPKILQTLGLIKRGRLLRAKKGIYGLRSSPVSWELERDVLSEATLPPLAEDDLPGLKVHAVSDYAGMWVIRREDNQEIVAIVSMFVDDGLAFGLREALLRFGELVAKKWKVKWQGLLSRTPFAGHITRGAVELEYSKEIMFVGTQIRLNHRGVEISQHLWLLQELQKRQLIHLRGQESLPVLHEGELRDEREDPIHLAEN